MANRKRNIQMKFYVTEEEKRLIDEKMAQLPTHRYGAYLRKMAIPFLLKSRLNLSFNWGLTFYLQAPISAAVQVMVDEGCVVAVHRDRRVIQRRQQVLLDIADIGGILPHPFQHILDVGAVDLQEPGLHHLGGVVVPGDTDHLPVGADGIHHELHQLVQTVPVQLFILDEDIVVDILQNDLPVAFTLPHPVLPDPAFSLGVGGLDGIGLDPCVIDNSLFCSLVFNWAGFS